MTLPALSLVVSAACHDAGKHDAAWLIDMERLETKLMIQLDACMAGMTESTAGCVGIGALADIMTRTLPEGGMDRMTSEQVEELLAVPALTAHL